jgi:preprotein translocase subunit YajC
LINVAYAMGAGGGTGAGAGGFSTFIPLILMFVIFYFLLIRPQQKKQKEHRTMIENLKVGDQIITGGSIHGRIISLNDTTLTVEIADKVRVKITRGSVAALINATQKNSPVTGKDNS